jgi:hypothetical protein
MPASKEESLQTIIQELQSKNERLEYEVNVQKALKSALKSELMRLRSPTVVAELNDLADKVSITNATGNDDLFLNAVIELLAAVRKQYAETPLEPAITAGDTARDIIWGQLKAQLTDGTSWTVSDAFNFQGFFAWGWDKHRQFVDNGFELPAPLLAPSSLKPDSVRGEPTALTQLVYALPSLPWPYTPAIWEPYVRTDARVSFTAEVPLATLVQGTDALLEHCEAAFDHRVSLVEPHFRTVTVNGINEMAATYAGSVVLQVTCRLLARG